MSKVISQGMMTALVCAALAPDIDADVVSRTVYVDDHAFFELSAGAMKLDHENIITAYGTEGRVDAGGAVKYYLKDRLGSTRVTMTDAGGTEESQMYYSFGRERYLVHPSKMTREKFTGKELDYDGPVFGVNGMFLTYFGARYYDAEIGMWTSPDPARQYHSPYLYTGNGAGPINGVDPNGLTWQSNFGFLMDFFTGGGETERTYGPGTVEGDEMIDSPGAFALREKFIKNKHGDVVDFEYTSERAAFETLGRPSSTGAQVGGFGGASAINNGDGTVTFNIENGAGARSFWYHLAKDRECANCSMRTIKQTFTWTEKISDHPGRFQVVKPEGR